MSKNQFNEFIGSVHFSEFQPKRFCKPKCFINHTFCWTQICSWPPQILFPDFLKGTLIMVSIYWLRDSLTFSNSERKVSCFFFSSALSNFVVFPVRFYRDLQVWFCMPCLSSLLNSSLEKDFIFKKHEISHSDSLLPGFFFTFCLFLEQH